MYFCLKLLSASSWGCELKWCWLYLQHVQEICQPLREAVSWNWNSQWSSSRNNTVSLFVRLWVEISGACLKCCKILVSLFVRLWVEIKIDVIPFSFVQVSLFVRLWVEISHLANTSMTRHRQPLREAVSWNTYPYNYVVLSNGQPLREAVSWNDEFQSESNHYCVSLFVRLWVEMLVILRQLSTMVSQPLREAVSWNTLILPQ